MTTNNLSELEHVLASLVLDDEDSPVVVFSALWPFCKVLRVSPEKLCREIYGMLKELLGSKRDLLMPTFTGGFRNGSCNLDLEPSTTGILSEYFRTTVEAQRSLSAFFSYAISGPSTDEFVKLRPQHAWGDGSVYDWMEKRNASFLMIGTHPTHCSYLHRMEWLAREVVFYRYPKKFSGTIIRNDVSYEIEETLFVRRLDPPPPVVNDFTPITDCLISGGMRVVNFYGVSMAGMSARQMRDAFLPQLLSDPFIVVKNEDRFESA
ncbi:MAG: AAC(3) family N-acetyltransferase [Candidatus Melainabacteria bacterium]|nr:AAC(3) family N-acetyltransferase [Candidatus Melainabacteria bacterium]